jgi:hypothetical protein
MEKEFCVDGIKIKIFEKPAFKAIGLTKFVRLDGKSIGQFLDEIRENGKYKKLEKTLDDPQQVWVCLSDNEGNSDADCRCTVCVMKTEKHNFLEFDENELFTLDIPMSEWVDFEVSEKQYDTGLPQFDAYKMIGNTGYKWNSKIPLHFDDQHEWEPRKKMHLLLPVICP